MPWWSLPPTATAAVSPESSFSMKKWGRFLDWDPKEVWALISLLAYLVVLHGRFAGWVGTFGTNVGGVLCFSAILFSWYGVNFVLGVGLHSDDEAGCCSGSCQPVAAT